MTARAGRGRRARPIAFATGVLCLWLIPGAAPAATLKRLHGFNGAGGFASQSPLIADANGNLFGTTAAGGGADRGVVFELSPPKVAGAAWTYTIIHSFGGTDDGADPLSGLAMNSNGVLFGTTYMGGSNDQGTAFMLAPPKIAGGAWAETLLFTFGGSKYTGYWPVGGVLLGAGGTLYGTTSYGGPNEAGLVFALAPPAVSGEAWTETVLHYFEAYGSGDGYSPQAGLAADAAGNLYGTTVAGGASPDSSGAVFELSPTGGGAYSESVIYSFGARANDGAFPAGPLLLGAGGVLYGTTLHGGAGGAGTVFELVPGPGGWTEKLLYSFANNAIDGVGPEGKLAIDTLGRIVGATPYGGTKTFGTLFRLTPTASPPWTEKILHDFTAAGDGATPYGGVFIAPSGTVYGTTSAGGAAGDGRWGYGTVYQYVP